MKRKAELSMRPAAVRSRERRLDAWIKRAESEWNAEIRVLMDKGMSFDEAYVAAGGMIIPLSGEANV